MQNNCRVINLFGGPGTGKSTVAADLFAYMKWHNMNVELVDEYAKQLSWERRYDTLTDQLYVIAKQNHKLQRLNKQVEWVITDSPLIMCLPYTDKDFLPNSFKPMVIELWKTYENINIFLKREKPFHPIGRHHNEHQSIQLDKDIKQLLIDNSVIHLDVPANDRAKTHIFNYIEKFYP